MPADTYFSRKNAKEKAFSGSKSKQWLESAKRQYLALIRRLCPDYTPPNTGEPKIGQVRPFSSSVYEDKRQARIAEVERLRSDTKELLAINSSLAEFCCVREDDYLLPELFQQMPTGGVELDKENISGWFKAGVCAVGIGSKLITKQLLEAKDYTQITAATKQVLTIIQSIKS